MSEKRSAEGTEMFAHMGETLSLLRSLRGYSQAELAEKCGLQSTQVSRYESGLVVPQLRQLEKLLRGLKVGLEVFIYAHVVVGEIQGVLDKGLPIEDLTMETFLRAVGRWSEVREAGAGRRDERQP